MCKIFAISDASKLKITPKFLEVVKNQVCAHDDHGFGYAVLTQDGKLGGERSIRPKSFKPLTPSDGLMSVVEKLPFVTKTNNTFGRLDVSNPKSFIAHGRFSTNTVNLSNTHPFVGSKLALIHNGVVTDEDGLVEKSLKTDCDTEILLKYWQRGGIKAIEKSVSGYYAMAILDASDSKLHIVRDDRAMLYIAWCRTINSYVIATTSEIITKVAAKMKWKIDQALEIQENTYAVFNGNEIASHVKIDPRATVYTKEFESRAGKAFGGSPLEDDVHDYGRYGDLDFRMGELPDKYTDEESFSYRELSEMEDNLMSKKGHSRVKSLIERYNDGVSNDDDGDNTVIDIDSIRKKA